MVSLDNRSRKNGVIDIAFKPFPGLHPIRSEAVIFDIIEKKSARILQEGLENRFTARLKKSKNV